MPTYSQLSEMIAKQVEDSIAENAEALEEAIRTGLEGTKSREEMNARMILNAMSVTARISIQSTLMILHDAGILTFEGGLRPDLELLPGGALPKKAPENDKRGAT